MVLLTLSQQDYIKEILEKFNMTNCNPVNTPMEVGIKLEKAQACDESLPYRELIGSINYLAVCTRPDISYCVSKLSQYLTCYDQTHWVAAKRVLRYLKKTINYGLVFKGDEMSLHGFSDSDWGNNIDDRRSYSGFCFSLCGATVSWEARKQRTVALSSTEAEYMSLSDSCKEAMYLQKLISELNICETLKIKIYVDNNGALRLAENSMYHGRTKHIDIRHHFIRDALKTNNITLEHVSTSNMGADIFTKPLPASKHYNCMKILNVKDVNNL